MEISLSFLATAGIMLAGDSILLLSDWCDASLGLLSCILLVLAAWRRRSGGWLLTLCTLGSTLGLSWGAFSLAAGVVRVVLVGWAVGLVALASERDEMGRAGWGSSCLLPIHFAALAYAAMLAAYRHSNYGWFVCERVAALGAVAAAHFGCRMSIAGMWVSGMPILAFGLVGLTAAAILYGARPRHLVGAGVLIAGFVALQVVLGLAAPVTALTISCCQVVAVALVAAVLVSVCRGRSAAGVSKLRPRSIRRCLCVSLGLTFALLLTCALPALSPPASEAPTSSPSRPSILIYPRGLLDWRLPDLERVGLVNAGMFGLFRHALEQCAAAEGGKVIIAEDGVTADALTDVSLVVFINPTEPIGKEGTARLKTFVESGGGLLVLGDHTNIGGSMAILNSILGFTAIRFNFDSAVPMRAHWQGCLEVRDHPITRGLRATGGDRLGSRAGREFLPRCAAEQLLQIAVGASLDVARPAFPIIVGRYGFADAGDSLNGGAGANMGDVTHNTGERIGDVVLVAGQTVGKGRVLVLGDTSPFQNCALFLSQRLVSNAIQWLTSGRERLYPRASARAVSDDIGLVDFSLAPRASLSLFTESSLGGLANCLARLGVRAVPVFSRDQWTRDAAYLFLVSPTRLGRRDVKALVDYISEGGNVILSQGYSELAPCEALLSRFGLAVENMPLGRGEPTSCVVHKCAWAISCRPDADDGDLAVGVRASAYGFPTIVTKRLGAGSLTLVGDSGLLLDGNLESEQGGELRNIKFLSDLILDLRSGGGRREGSSAN